MDLFSLFKVSILGNNYYVFVIIDDYAKSALILFLAHKDKAPKVLKKLCKQLQNKERCPSIAIRMEENWRMRE